MESLAVCCSELVVTLLVTFSHLDEKFDLAIDIRQYMDGTTVLDSGGVKATQEVSDRLIPDTQTL